MASIPTAHPLDQDTHPLPDIFTEITPYNELHDFELGEVFAHAGMHEYALGQAQWSPGKESSDVFPLQMANEFGFNYPNWSLDLDLELLRGEGEFRPEPTTTNSTPDNNPNPPISPSPQKEPYTALDDLLRSTSQLATQRALYMTTSPPAILESQSPHNTTTLYSHSPFHDECSSPATITSQYTDDWDIGPRTPTSLTSHKRRRLDEGASTSLGSSPKTGTELSDNTTKRRRSHSPLTNRPLLPLHSEDKPHEENKEEDDDNDLFTPLEMPDGSTRFTSNWLPVDPEGGFTIGMPDYGNGSAGPGFDPMADIGFGREAFLSVGD